jgi:membrane-bound lytic murein transglycosylase MltF
MELNQFVSQNRKGSLLGNVLFERYFEDERWVSDPISEENRARFNKVSAVVREFAEPYGLDWIQLTALAYQESRFDQDTVSHAGAVGVMQIRPETARDMGIEDVSGLRDNVRAGVTYIAFIRDRYFMAEEIPEDARMDFVFAAYNAGPRKILQAREQARETGRDPNEWFGNVEYAALRTISREPVRYVANINKYTTALRLSMERIEASTNSKR